MDLRLISLHLRNFKGQREVVFKPDGCDTNVSGANETGKTTLADSMSWLLFGKDSLQQSDFEIKPIDPDTGKPEHYLDHSVSATLGLDGNEISLARVLREKWTKKRGSSTQEFSGHTSEFFINGVPKPEKEFNARIAEIADSQTFQMLTNPRYFAAVMPWQKRRQVLLDICGNVTDEDVILSDIRLEPLADILTKRSIDDHKSVIKAGRKKINETLESIGPRIQENQRSITANDADPVKVATEINRLNQDRARKLEELSRIQNGGEIAEKTKELREVEGKIIALQNEQAQSVNKPIQDRMANIARLTSEITTNQFKISSANSGIQLNNQKIIGFQGKIAELRKEWHEVNDSAMQEGSESCPTCGQSLPENMLKSSQEKFNLNKANQLSKIKADGLMQSKFIDRLTAENEKLTKECEALATVVASAQVAIQTLEADIEELKTKPALMPEELNELRARATVLESAISELQIGTHDASAEVKAAIEALDLEIQNLNTIKAQLDANKKNLDRIEELKKGQKRLNTEFERLESDLYLLEMFTRKKVSMLTDRINSKFSLARFRLFEDQVNGGLAECCEVMVNSVPYDSMNNASRINAGLDIINTLSDHYGITLPVWLDNIESVNNPLSTKSQQIKLFVSNDATLKIERIEHGNSSRQAA